MLGPHLGHRLHPAFRIRRPALRSRPADGSPVYGKTIALIYMCAFPDWEYVSAHAATGLRPQRTTPLHGYTPTGPRAAARPNGGRAAHGRPRAMLPFLREAPSGPPESRLQLQAFSKSGGTTENPRSETRDPVCIPEDALRNHQKKGTGVRVRGDPCRICVTEKTG